MKRNNLIFILAVAPFVACELGIYIAFLCGNLPPQTEIAVKYAGVILCAVFCLGACFTKKTYRLTLAVALLFTVLSDYFLLVTGTHFVIGLSTFIAAQLLHGATLALLAKKVPVITLCVRAALLVAAIVTLLCLKIFDPVVILAAIYFILLLCNFADGVILCVKNWRALPYCLGLLLFIGCDICVGLFNFNNVLSVALPQEVIDFANVGMWAFYLPSQTLIAINQIPLEVCREK